MEENSQSKTIMILAGEPSGDLHGGNLCRRLKELDPEVRLFGMGGEMMEEAGVELVQRIGRTGVVGFWEVFKDIGRYRKIFYYLVGVMEERRPDAVVLIDYPGFNIRFARRARLFGAKVIYYISPQIWAWGGKRIETLKRSVDKMVVIFEFEKEVYRPSGLDVEFVGHPLIDTIDPGDWEEGKKLRAELKGRPVIGLLPGSRESEIERLLPILLETAAIVRQQSKEAVFALPLASANLKPLVEGYLKNSPVEVRLLEGKTRPLLAASDLLIVASGTATLEAAVFNTPMIVVYKLNFFSWLFSRAVIKIPYIGLANVIYGEKIVPEYIQFKARPALIARRALDILTHPEVRERMIEQLGVVRKKLGEPGASLRAAQAVLAASRLRGNAASAPKRNK